MRRTGKALPVVSGALDTDLKISLLELDMPNRIILAVNRSLPQSALSDCYELCVSFATFLDEAVFVGGFEGEALAELKEWMTTKARAEDLAVVEPRQVSPAPMTSADFIFSADGKPDWGAMWGTFCELALYGGPPHRGADSALEADAETREPAEDIDAIAEIRRGVWETTGLFSEPAEPGWLAITCSSRKMAAWLCAAIILENVDARCDDERLLVPASAGFRLKDEVKSVITVVAKTNHYWSAHVQEQEALAQREAVG
jgi:hypothetical protein